MICNNFSNLSYVYKSNHRIKITCQKSCGDFNIVKGKSTKATIIII